MWKRSGLPGGENGGDEVVRHVDGQRVGLSDDRLARFDAPPVGGKVLAAVRGVWQDGGSGS